MQPDQPDPCPWPREAIPPDLLAWIKQTFDEEACLAELRDAEVNGTFTLDEFVDEIKEKAGLK